MARSGITLTATKPSPPMRSPSLGLRSMMDGRLPYCGRVWTMRWSYTSAVWRHWSLPLAAETREIRILKVG